MSVSNNLTGVDGIPGAGRKEYAIRKARVRANKAYKIMQSGQWVTNQRTYNTRSGANSAGAKLMLEVSTHCDVEASCLVKRVRETGEGWRWFLGLSDRLPQQPSS